ncbi:hypothetical protein GCM10019059_26400 [Camelimonas fluminis]|uniref:Lipoprotein n=1 Tax=Camelimonas fluminis TaxID=1576911 RepID=A0ABV7UPW7_9HYPH|nr:hypothetical protein [Camelimonas fluminis]GHE65377.1 hypothetical protein GCM10019059_26400 [Camelimonas fluminis]
MSWRAMTLAGERGRKLAIGATLAIAVMAGCVGAATAQTVPRVATPSPVNQKLVDRFDDLLDHKQYAALGDALEREHDAGRGRLARSWQDRRLRDGGSAYLGFVYSRELMRSAARSAPRDRTRLREQASLVAIYTMAVLTIDGPRCADASAPSARSEQLFDLAAEAFSWAAAMPEGRRDRMIDEALALEQATAPLRRDDDFICLGGAEHIARALQDPASQVESRGGDAGVTVTPGRSMAARFADPATTRPMQALARRTIRADLCRMLDQMKT